MLRLFVKRLVLPAVAVAYCTGTNLQSAEPASAKAPKRTSSQPTIRQFAADDPSGQTDD